jgi:hypothetical protein
MFTILSAVARNRCRRAIRNGTVLPCALGGANGTWRNQCAVALTWLLAATIAVTEETAQSMGYIRWFCCSFSLRTGPGRSRPMAKQRQAAQVRQNQSFKGRQFTAEVILWAVRWYLMFPISYRDLELMWRCCMEQRRGSQYPPVQSGLMRCGWRPGDPIPT